MNSHNLPTPGAYVNDEVIVDYGSTGISLPFFIGILIGVIGIVALFTRVMPVGLFPFGDGMLFFGLILSVAIVIFYLDKKKATLEIAQEALIIRRVFHWPVVIRKETIATVEVRYNVPPVPIWLQKILILIVIPASSAGVIYGEYLQLVSGEITSTSFFVHLGFDISIVLFSLAIYYHSRIRLDYPSVLVITTNTKKLAGIYGKNPEEIAKMLGKSL
ncbi:MAG: hypothetical protein M0Q91_12310 [Methanoregula sp.]|jgi:hypothetical protein|nr:hypothetical protein [Methanoregula sp.]